MGRGGGGGGGGGVWLQQRLVSGGRAGVLGQSRAGRAGRSSHHRVRPGLLHGALGDLTEVVGGEVEVFTVYLVVEVHDPSRGKPERY